MNLTPQQQAILTAQNVSVAVSAGAGCGKTFVLTERFIRFLRERVGQPDPLAGIVAITFTNKAAREMRHRVRQACRRELENAPPEHIDYWVGVLRGLDVARISTIHSFASTLLRRFSVEAGLDPAFELPESSLHATFVERAVQRAVCDLIEANDEDTRQLVLRLTLETVFQVIAALIPGLRSHPTPAQLDNFTPEELWDEWQDVWNKQCVPLIMKDFTGSPLVAQAVALFHEHVPSHDGMRERCARLLEMLTNPPTSDHAAWFDEIPGHARVQGGGGAGAWDNPEIYEEVKNTLAELRDTVKPLAKKFEIAATVNLDATEVSLRAHRVARRVLEKLEERKFQEGIVEFDDLLCRTRDLLRSSAIAHRAAAGLELLMVDEFQDTDPIQTEIVQQLCGETIEHGRLFLVGDSKQSIYRFRGADPHVFATLREGLPESGRLPLSINFRSQPAILNFVNYTFAPEIPDYEPLQAHCPQLSPQPAIEFLFPRLEEKTSADETRALEAKWLAARIQQLLEDDTLRVRDDKTKELRFVQPGDITILFRTLNYITYYESALTQWGIPYYVVKSKAFFAQQEIQDMAHLCRWLDDPSDELSLVGILRSPLFGLTDDTLFTLKRDRWTALADGLANPPKITDENQASQVARAQRILQELVESKDVLPLPDLLNLAIERTGYDAALLVEYLGPRKVANLRKLIDLARDFSESAAVTLADFARRLQDAVHEPPDEEVAATHPEVGDVVRMMTIHQSKGLEFPVVVLAGITALEQAPGNAANYHKDLGPVISTPEVTAEDLGATDPENEEGPQSSSGGNNLAQIIYRELETIEDDAERTRVLYVALTRPRDHLILSGCIEEEKKRQSSWMKLLTRRFDLKTGQPAVDPYMGSVGGTIHDPNSFPEILVHLNEPKPASLDQRPDPTRAPLRDYRHLLLDAASEAEPELFKEVAIDPSRRTQFTVTELTTNDYEAHSGLRDTEADRDEDQRERELLETSDFQETLLAEERQTVGTLVHQVMEQLQITNLEGATPNALEEQIDAIFEKLPSDAAKHKKTVRDKVAMITDSQQWREASTARQFYREIPFRLRWSSRSDGKIETASEIVGVIDGLFQDAQGDWHLFDYKITENTDKSDADFANRYELQLLIYAIAIEQALGIAPTSATLIRVDQKVRAVSVECDPQALSRCHRRIDQALAIARAPQQTNSAGSINFKDGSQP